MVIINIDFDNLPVNFSGKTVSEFYVSFLKNDEGHRYYGPSVIYDSKEKFWSFNDKHYGSIEYNADGSYYFNYSQRQFIKDLSKQWLL